MQSAEFKRNRVLVTGGAGFLGSHLCERLVNAGDDVICLDNFFTGNKDNVAHLFKHTNFELIRHDITFPLYLEVDQIYNLACPASPIHYQASCDTDAAVFREQKCSEDSSNFSPALCATSS